MKIGLLLIAAPDAVAPATIARKAEEVGFESFWLPTAPSPCLLRLRSGQASPHKGRGDL